jgi:hypothetical protein
MRMVTIKREENVFARRIASLGTRDKNVTEPLNSGGIVSPAAVSDFQTEQPELVRNLMRY